MKKNIVSGLFFVIMLIFVVLSQLYIIDGNTMYNSIILTVLILSTCGYFIAFGKCSNPINGSNIAIHFLLTLMYVFLVSLSVYYIPFMKATYTFNTIVGVAQTSLFYNSMRLLSAKIKKSHLFLSRFLFVFGAVMFFGFFLFGIVNIFSPGVITSRL